MGKGPGEFKQAAAASDGEESGHNGASASSTAGSPKKKKKQQGGKKLVKGKAKSKAKGSNVTRNCFICPERKKSNSRFCKGHHGSMENIRNQAIRDGKVEVFNDLFYDEIKCRSALERFDKENPPGKFRKRLIDWHSWSKAFGVRIARTLRETDTLMDETDFVAWSMMYRLTTKEVAKAKWKVMIADINHPGEGDGEDRELYVQTVKKQRIRDVERYEDGATTEGSKQMKGLKAEDVDALKQFAGQSANDHTSAFVNGPTGGDSGKLTAVQAPELSVQDKKKPVNVAVAGPAANLRYDRERKKIEPVLEKAEADMLEAVGEFDKFKKETEVEKTPVVPSQILRYHRMLVINIQMLQMFKETSCDEAAMKQRFAECKNAMEVAPGTPASSAAPGTPAARAWDSKASGSSPKADASPGTPAGAAPGTPAEFHLEKNTSEDEFTKQFIKLLRSLPLRYHPSREYQSIRSWSEMDTIINKMSDVETSEDLDVLIGYWQKAVGFTNKMIGICREAAKTMVSSIANHKRAELRAVKQEQQKTAQYFVSFNFILFQSIQSFIQLLACSIVCSLSRSIA